MICGGSPPCARAMCSTSKARSSSSYHQRRSHRELSGSNGLRLISTVTPSTPSLRSAWCRVARADQPHARWVTLGRSACPVQVINCRVGHGPSAAARHLITDTNAGGRRGRDGPEGDIAGVRCVSRSLSAIASFCLSGSSKLKLDVRFDEWRFAFDMPPNYHASASRQDLFAVI